MNWVAASLLSALFLGVYELCTKHAVRANSVVPVLFFSTLTAALVWLGLLSVQGWVPGLLPPALVPDSLTWTQHGQLLFKSMLVASSWVFTYLAVKHLPLSLVMSLRRGSTLVAFAGGVFLFGERNPWQKLPAVLGILAGMALTMLG